MQQSNNVNIKYKVFIYTLWSQASSRASKAAMDTTELSSTVCDISNSSIQNPVATISSAR